MHYSRHCEPTGPRIARPDDRLREAIQNPSAERFWIASSLQCKIASQFCHELLAMTRLREMRRNDVERTGGSAPPFRVRGDRHQCALGDGGGEGGLLAGVERGCRELLDDGGEPRYAEIAQRCFDCGLS